MLLSGEEIKKNLGKDIIIEPFRPSQLNPNSYDLHRGPEPLVELLNQTYYGHLRKALQTCIKGICLQFGELNRAAAKQSG